MLRRFAPVLAALGLLACAPESAEEVGPAVSEGQLAGANDFAAARAKMDEIREDLAANQGHLRGVLTPEQARAYSAAFWKLDRVTAASQDYARKAVSLAANLARETAALQADTSVVGRCGLAADAKVRDLYESAKSLANAHVFGVGRSSPAYAVRAFHAYLAGNQRMRACISRDLEDLEADLGANHAQVMVQVALENPRADALTIVRETFEPFANASESVTQLSTALEQFARTQDVGALGNAVASPVGKVCGGVLAILNVGDRASELAEGRYQDFLENAVVGGAGDLAALADAVSLLDGVVESGRAQRFVERVAGFAEVTGRIAAGVGVVTSAIDLANDVQSYESDRLLYVARIAADAAALQASIIAVAGLSTLIPVAGAIVLLTQTVLAVVEYWHERQDARRRTADAQALLREIGFAPAVADLLAGADSEYLAILTDDADLRLGLDPASVQALATFAVTVPRGPEAFFLMPDNVRWVTNARGVKRLFALSDASTVDMLRVTTGTTEGMLVRGVLDRCFTLKGGAFVSKQSVMGALADCKLSSDEAETAAIGRLETWLRPRL